MAAEGSSRAGVQVGLSSLSPPPGLFLGRPAGCTAGRTPPPAVASRAAVDLARGGGGALPTELLTTPERTLGDGAAASGDDFQKMCILYK